MILMSASCKSENDESLAENFPENDIDYDVSAARPNILIFLADDMTWRDCEPYGNTDVRTPNIQKLAEEGIKFNNMYTATAMCAPTRQQFFTGLFPVRNGAYPNHSQVYDGVQSMAHYFQSIEYNVVLIGKQHYGPKSSFPFTYLGGRGSDNGTGVEIEIDRLRPIINSNKPFLAIVAQNQPHLPWNRGNADAYDPSSFVIPDYMVDTEFTRNELTKYYAEITYMDYMLGDCLDMIEQAGKTDNTLAIFTSEQGSTHPFAKWTCYDSGLKTGFIARWPGVIPAGSETSAMCQYVDVVPTLLDIVDIKADTVDTGVSDAYGKRGFDGRSFEAVLIGEAEEHGDVVFGVQTTVGMNNGSSSYPVRSVRNKQYKYIRNLSYEIPFQNNETELEGRHYRHWLKITEDQPEVHEWVKKYQFRPEEELYDIVNDPWEKINIIDDPAQVAVKSELRSALDAWMDRQGDEGKATEANAWSRIKK